MARYRILKIYRKFRSRTWDYAVVPEIKLEGQWLKDLGFDIGKNIKVKQQKGKLIIKITNKQRRL